MYLTNSNGSNSAAVSPMTSSLPSKVGGTAFAFGPSSPQPSQPFVYNSVPMQQQYVPLPMSMPVQMPVAAVAAVAAVPPVSTIPTNSTYTLMRSHAHTHLASHAVNHTLTLI